MAGPDYRALAAQSRKDADATPLVNVRERCLRAEAAWLAMATRQDSAEVARKGREAAPAAAPLA